MNTKQIALLLAVIMYSNCFPACREVVYDHHLLALTWPSQYCSEHSCVRDWDRIWNGKSMITHGFWPASTDLAYLTCLAQHEHDPYCHQPYSYNDDVFSDQQIAKMRKFWPKLSNPRNFWSYQWVRHGTCYLDILHNKYKSNSPLRQLYKAYYLQTVNKVRDLDIRLYRGRVQSKQSLARMIQLNADSFYAVCGDDDEIDQIRICFSITAEPGKQKIINCPANRDIAQCRFPIFIK